MLDNKWYGPRMHYELSALQSILISSPGIKPISAILNNNIGKEIILLVTEPTNKAKEFKGRNITRLMLKAGLINTSYGPVCFLLFYFPDPITGAQVTYENTINPKDYAHISIFNQLSDQKYWHIVIADEFGSIVNVYEFLNEYGLKETLTQVGSVCEKIDITDFMAAKSEYESKYSIDQLLQMV